MSELKNLKPGEARCPDHPSTKELVSRDCTGAPDAILEESYEFIGVLGQTQLKFVGLLSKYNFYNILFCEGCIIK